MSIVDFSDIQGPVWIHLCGELSKWEFGGERVVGDVVRNQGG